MRISAGGARDFDNRNRTGGREAGKHRGSSIGGARKAANNRSNRAGDAREAGIKQQEQHNWMGQGSCDQLEKEY